MYLSCSALALYTAVVPPKLSELPRDSGGILSVLHERNVTRLAADGFRILEGGELSICCARFEPAGRNEPQLDALQVRITSEVVSSGEAWFSTVIHAGRTWLRFNLVNLHTREEHIHRLAALVDRTARALSLR